MVLPQIYTTRCTESANPTAKPKRSLSGTSSKAGRTLEALTNAGFARGDPVGRNSRYEQPQSPAPRPQIRRIGRPSPSAPPRIMGETRYGSSAKKSPLCHRKIWAARMVSARRSLPPEAMRHDEMEEYILHCALCPALPRLLAGGGMAATSASLDDYEAPHPAMLDKGEMLPRAHNLRQQPFVPRADGTAITATCPKASCDSHLEACSDCWALVRADGAAAMGFLPRFSLSAISASPGLQET